jgi:hypothetical protein
MTEPASNSDVAIAQRHRGRRWALLTAQSSLGSGIPGRRALHADAILPGPDTRPRDPDQPVTAPLAAHAPIGVIVINLGALGHPIPTTGTTKDTPRPSSAIPHNSSVPPKS